MKNAVEILKSNKEVSAYKVVEQTTQSYELFFVHEKLETVRKAHSLDSEATVYVDHDGKLGHSAFAVYASTTEKELEKKVADAVKKAKMVNNQPYDLPSGEKTDCVLESNISSVQAKALGAKVARIVFGANDVAQCAINALEVFVVERKTRVLNSKGIDKTQTKYTVSIEAIPTCDGEKESVELFETYTLAELDEEWLSKEINARMHDVKARSVAQRPQKKIDCPVILNANELATLFEELAYDTNFANVYMHNNLRNVGDKLQSDPKRDLLTITMKGEIKGSPRSAKFDADGSSLKDTVIVKDGVISGGYGAYRFAQYLGKESTGMLGCIEVECGKAPVADMLATPHLECVYLSGLQVDLYNDYIGGEIRLAYHFDGEKRVPVTGISMSGKLSDVLNTVVLSKEKTVYGAYSGPEKALMSNINVF